MKKVLLLAFWFSTIAAVAAPAQATLDRAVTNAPAKGSVAAISPADQLAKEVGDCVTRINTLDDIPSVAKVGLAAVSKETGVNINRLESQKKTYGIGLGSLLVCTEMSKAARQPTSVFVKQRFLGRDWGRLASDNNFDLATVLPMLQRVERKMEAARKK